MAAVDLIKSAFHNLAEDKMLSEGADAQKTTLKIIYCGRI